MKTIELKDAYARLQDCAAVIVDNDALVYPSLGEIENTPKNEFLYLFWELDGEEYSVRCIEQDNQTVRVSDDGALMILEDTGGCRVQLTLLVPVQTPDNALSEKS